MMSYFLGVMVFIVNNSLQKNLCSIINQYYKLVFIIDNKFIMLCFHFNNYFALFNSFQVLSRVLRLVFYIRGNPNNYLGGAKIKKQIKFIYDLTNFQQLFRGVSKLQGPVQLATVLYRTVQKVVVGEQQQLVYDKHQWGFLCVL
eukprot:TRINITY_DN36170_c0_g1_i1.p1 TRINITY_DN36170_c0_g1~~TRINITY_DN36170_c0_g1_i1.p1  ORF type:complete len:144 (-),score=6.25 TRINITY_DN36170_c0_g1_i1:242-673(-)